MDKPKLLELKGDALTELRYTYVGTVQMNGEYRYGGPGTLVTMNTEFDLMIDALKKVPSSLTALIAYDDADTTYDYALRQYDGADVRQDDGPPIYSEVSDIKPKLEFNNF